MKSKGQQQPPATERPAGSTPTRGTIASQTKTTRRLDRAVKREADGRMAGEDKAVGRWEGEGGLTPPAKKGGGE